MLYKLQLLGVGDTVFNFCSTSDFKSICLEFIVDLDPLLFVLFTADICTDLDSRVVSCADDTALYANLKTVLLWPVHYLEILNPSKTHSMIVSEPKTFHLLIRCFYGRLL